MIDAAIHEYGGGLSPENIERVISTPIAVINAMLDCAADRNRVDSQGSSHEDRAGQSAQQEMKAHLLEHFYIPGWS